MHRVIEDHLEEVLSESPGDQNSPAAAHLAECEACSEEVAEMRLQASMLRALRVPKGLDENPRPGFYARVMERIEAQHPASVWQLFFDSALARRIAIASMALVVLFSVYLVSSERYTDQPRATIVFSGDDQGMTLSKSGWPDRDTVLVNLVTYREQ